jgi:FtsP/CotA-like multicopper oxidase with cupredoxin domain
VEPGQAFVYEFAPPDAGTFWYHPHLRSSEQLAHGLYGALIVEEEKPIKVDRDILWMIDDWRLLDDGSINENFSDRHDISHEGRVGNRVTINGRPLKEFPVRVGERLRLRLVNTANARTFGLNFGDLKPLVIALDGQPVTPHPPADNRVVMGSAMRADLIVDVTGEPGEKTTIVDDYYDQTTYDFLTIVRGPEPPLREAGSEALPTLMPNPLPEPDLADAIAQGIVIEGGSKGYLEEAIYKGEKYDARKLWRQHKKIWTLNGVASHGVTMEPMHSLRLGRSYRWQMKNDTAWEHPMHLHGHHFRVLTRNGKPVAHRPWADTVLLQPDEVVEVAFVADNPGNWLFHCHILEHHEGGMGAVVRVA